MPKIPLYNHTPEGGQSTNVRANPNIYSGVAAAGERMGAVVAGIGNQLADFELKKREAVNYATVQDADRKMKEGWLLFQDELATNGDETTWASNWAKKAAEIDKEISGKHVPEMIRPRLKAMSDAWKMQTGLALKSAVTAKEIQRASAQVLLSYEQALNEGNVEGAQQLIADGEKVGLFSPKDVAKYTSEAPMIADRKAALTMVTNSPITAEAELREKTDGGKQYKNFKNLDEQSRLTLINHAEEGARKMRTDNYNALLKRNIEKNPATEDEIKGMVERQEITATQGQSYLNGQAIGRYAPPGTFPKLSAEIGDYDPNAADADEKYGKLLEKITFSNMAPPLQARAIEKLNERKDKAGAINTPAANAGKAAIKDAFDRGIYGEFENKEMAGKVTLDKKLYAKAVQIQAENQDALAGYLKDNPKANQADVVKFVQGLNEKHVTQDVSKLFMPKRPVTMGDAETSARLDVLIEQYRKDRIESNTNKK